MPFYLFCHEAAHLISVIGVIVHEGFSFEPLHKEPWNEETTDDDHLLLSLNVLLEDGSSTDR